MDLDVDDFDDYAYDESDGTEVDYIFFTDLPPPARAPSTTTMATPASAK